MDFKTLLVFFALLSICAATLQVQIQGDEVQDSGSGRSLVLTVQIITTATSPTTNDQVASISASNANLPANFAFSASVPAGTCTATSCTQTIPMTFSLTDPTGFCALEGSYRFDTTMTPSAADSFTLNIRGHDLNCAPTLYNVAANVTSLGTFADASFTQTKSSFAVGDTVYFPFQVSYSDLTVSSVTFSDITVVRVGDVSSYTQLYSAGTATSQDLNFQVTPITTAVANGGVAYASFSLQISQRSPLFFAVYGIQTYQFQVVLDVQFKNSKRDVSQPATKLHGDFTLVVHGSGLSKVIASPRSVDNEANESVDMFGTLVNGVSNFLLKRNIV